MERPSELMNSNTWNICTRILVLGWTHSEPKLKYRTSRKNIETLLFGENCLQKSRKRAEKSKKSDSIKKG